MCLHQGFSRIAWALALLLLWTVRTWAGNTLPPSSVEQWRLAIGTMMRPFVVSGCLPTAYATVTLNAFACTALVKDNNQALTPVVQSASAVVLSTANGTYWLIAHRDTSSTMSGWTRQAGTHYLWQQAATIPTIPTGTTLLAAVTVAGNIITAVTDYRTPYSWVTSGYYSVKDPLYGAVGDGTTNDRTAIQAAFNAAPPLGGGRKVFFPTGSYYLGAFSSADAVIDLSALGQNIRMETDKDVELVVNTTADVQPHIIYLQNNSHFSAGPVRFRDTGYDSSKTWHGAHGFFLYNNAGNWGDVILEGVYGNKLVSPVTINSAVVDSTNRIRGLKIGQIFCDDCYYGFVAGEDGDSVNIGYLYTHQAYRSIYLYGVSGYHVGQIVARNQRSTTGAVNIARAVGGLNTFDIALRYLNLNTTVNITHVLVNHLDLLGGGIYGLDLDIEVDASTTNYTPIRFVNYSGGAESGAASTNFVRDVQLKGRCDSNALAISAGASYTGKGNLSFIDGYFFKYNDTIPSKFYLNSGVVVRTGAIGSQVLWTAATVNPALGNGTISSNVDVIGHMATVNIDMTMGGTTTYGTGAWYFDSISNGNFIPIPTVTSVGSVFMYDTSSGTNYTGVAVIAAGASRITMYVHNNTGSVSATIPFTWATGDRIVVTITYPFS